MTVMTQSVRAGFSLGLLDMERFVYPPYWEGDIDIMGGANFDRLYHKLKVLLLLLLLLLCCCCH